jgi:Spy/CpxP family protein refolding chaperone
MLSGENKNKALALIALVFLLGVALGAVGHSVADRRVLGARSPAQPPAFLQPRPNPPRAMARLTNELKLTPEQQKQIGDILADMQHRYDAVHDQMNPQFEEIREQGHEQIRQVLSPEQRPKFEDFLRRVDQERRRRAGVNATSAPNGNGAPTNTNPALNSNTSPNSSH